MEELEEGLKALKKMATPQEAQECQLNQTSGSSQTEPPTKKHTQTGMCTYAADVQLSLYVDLSTTGAEALPKVIA